VLIDLIRGAQGTSACGRCPHHHERGLALKRVLVEGIFISRPEHFLAGRVYARMGNTACEKEARMNRPILACALFAFAAAGLAAQDASQSSPYQGTSNPPADDAIITTSDAPPKPPAGHPMETLSTASQANTAVQPAEPVTTQRVMPNPSTRVSVMATSNMVPQDYGDGTDEGIVGVAPNAPVLRTRPSAVDPDGDIVHPASLPPGTLGEGTVIRVRLMNDLSSSLSKVGDEFRSRVATDVLQGGQVVIPAGSEINGKVADVSTGHFAGHGSILLRPDTVRLADGSSYSLRAIVGSTPGSNTRVDSEGDISPGSRMKRNAIMYGAVAGGGAITGAVIGGPWGALAGSLVGAGVVTTHLLVSHPQASLDSGSVLMLTTTEPVQLVPAGAPGN
jgi:hypothetical protein